MSHDMSHLVRVEVTGIFDIVSVTGYRDDEEVQFGDDGTPLFDADGQPVVKTVRVALTEDICKGGFAMLDPAETNIRALVRSGLVRIAPKPTAKPKGA